MTTPVRVAAIAILLRPATNLTGWEVFWVRRAPNLAFLGGFWAFPGGGVEPGDRDLVATCARELEEETGVALPASTTTFLVAGRTVTPPWAQLRFDATYFVAVAPAGAAPDVTRAGGELVDGEWTDPDTALRRWADGERLTTPVAVRALRAIAAGGEPPLIAARLADDLAASATIDALRCWDLAPGLGMAALRSPTIPPATHTNCFVIGTTDVIVTDPGSPEPEEQAALDESLAARGLPVREIWLTHHHIDHVAGVEHLRARHPVPVAAHRATAEVLSGALRIDRLLEDDELVPLGDRRLRAVFTPGHTLGHLCFLEETTRYLLAGDHVAGVGTVVIDPDEGDMQLYLESITKLEGLGVRALLPAHGPLLTEPGAKLAEYRRHRLWREARVLEELRATPRTTAALTPDVYRDVPPALYGFAERSLRAHLVKLVREGRAVEEPGGFRRS
jgi:glyoxylase-like metal-dependent hydrolase (beta-lactamase superfamily II)/8-oxo-dGTP pyrophosphatase MutT (NUDIX family)